MCLWRVLGLWLPPIAHKFRGQGRAEWSKLFPIADWAGSGVQCGASRSPASQQGAVAMGGPSAAECPQCTLPVQLGKHLCWGEPCGSRIRPSGLTWAVGQRAACAPHCAGPAQHHDAFPGCWCSRTH